MLISGKIIVSKLSPDDLVLDIKASAYLKHGQVSSDKLYLASLWDRIWLLMNKLTKCAKNVHRDYTYCAQ